MIDIFWLEQTAAGLPPTDDWLSHAETERLCALRFPKRRDDWKLGRWTAKRAVSLWLKLPLDPQSLARVEIHPAPGGAPEVTVAGEPAPITISISHRDGRAVCAVGRASLLVGCDLEIVETRSDAFAADYFTDQEQALLSPSSPQARLQMLALLWSAKESTLKALRIGLRLNPHAIQIELNGRLALACVGLKPRPEVSIWSPLQATHGGRTFQGWWRRTGRLVRTMVAEPAPAPPITFQM